MSISFWKGLEAAPLGERLAEAEVFAHLAFNEQGLMPVIAQQARTGEVLMLAWMNLEALKITLEEGRACYWSRSRGRLWRKGERSGQVQWVKGVRLDCDADALLLLVDQQGPACHTGRAGCFYFEFRAGQVEVVAEPVVDPQVLYGG